MQQFPEGPLSRETTVFEAMRRYWGLVLLVTAAFALYGIAFGYLRDPTFEAAATIVLEEPESFLFESSQTAGQRDQYLAEQEEVISSVVVAERAAQLIGEESDNEVDADYVLARTTTALDSNTGFIVVSFVASSASDSALGANSVVEAYETLQLEQVQIDAETEIASLDAALALLGEDLESIQDQIEQARPEESADLDEQLTDLLNELVDLRARRQAVIDNELLTVEQEQLQLEDIRSQLDDLFAEMSTANLYRDLELQQPELASLLERESSLLQLEQELSNRQRRVELETEFSDSGIVLFSPAQPGAEQGVGTVPLTVILGMLGFVVGGFIAYYLAIRREKVSASRDPEVVLGAPLLAEIPHFGGERISSPLPVADHPDSGVSESFRFLASSLLVHHMPRIQASGDSLVGDGAPDSSARRARSSLVAMVSASGGDGKTLLVANTALAAARAGNEVLAIDADFGTQDLSQILIGSENRGERGLTDAVLDTDASLPVVTVDETGGGRLHLMSSGHSDIVAGSFLRNEGLSSFFARLKNEYDVILIDTPPLLQVAYTGLLVRLAESVIVVVRHDSDISELEEVSNRLQMTDTPVMGYAYNGAPLRRSLAGSEGSLGNEGFRP